MFFEEQKGSAKRKADKILKKLNNNNKSHSRHFTFDECSDMGLNVVKLEDDATLQDLVLSVHHSYVITLDNSTATKIIENHIGARYITTQVL